MAEFPVVGGPEPLPDTPPPPTGLAIATLVLGILAVVLAPLLIGGILGVVAVGLGALFLRGRPQSRRMAIWGFGLGILGTLVAAGVGVVLYRAYHRWNSEMASYRGGVEETEPPSDWVGAKAPALSFTTLEGEHVELGQFKGRPVVLNFWATWCGACKREQPNLDRLAREVPDVVVLGLSDEPESTLRSLDVKLAYRIASVPSPPAPFDGVASLPTTVFIDRNGVIADVRIGYMEFEDLKARSATASYAGTPREAAAVTAELELQAKEGWSADITGTSSMTVCQWDGDPAPRLLVATQAAQLLVLDAGGAVKARLALPPNATAIDCANLTDGSPRILAYQNWGEEVSVLDGSGQLLWSYRCPGGVNGAHWGDIDGDRHVDVVVGMNGDGGLHAVSPQGRRLWRVTQIGNVWGQAVVPAAGSRGSLVVATEAGGSIRIYDDEGDETANLRPLGDYYTAVAATTSGDEGPQQILALGRNRVVALDPEGRVAWQAPTKASSGAWRSTFFAHGRLTDDGASQWVFPSRRKALSVTSRDGRRLVELALREEPSAYAVLPAPKGKGMLVVASGNTVRAYTLEKGAPPPH
jgi:thiol-disulfide isomerase/thioredoxin